MAKENNLTDFLTDVADAIREKKGTKELINPQDFSSEIKSIKSDPKLETLTRRYTANKTETIEPSGEIDGFSSVTIEVDVPTSGSTDYKIQSKNVRVTENNKETEIKPDRDYHYMDVVNVTTDISMQEKSVTYNDNVSGAVIEADSGYGGLSKVTVNVDVPNQGSDVSIEPVRDVYIQENNHTRVIRPVVGYDALAGVNVNVNIPLQNKEVEIAGETIIFADDPYKGLNSVKVTPKIVVKEPVPKDVNFYDYDGTLLYSYTKDKALALTALPTVPSAPEGLGLEGTVEWNYTLAQIKDMGVCEVGSIYTKNRGLALVFDIPYDNFSLVLRLRCSSGDANVDWGDGVNSTVGGQENIGHTYTKAGRYVISYDAKTDATIKVGNSDYNVCNDIGTSTEYGFAHSTLLVGAVLGKNCDLNDYAFYNCGLSYCIISKEVTSTTIASSAFSYCGQLKHITFPCAMQLNLSAFSYSGLRHLSLPMNGGDAIADNVTSAFPYCANLRRLVLPPADKTTTFSLLNLANTYSLCQLIVKKGRTTFTHRITLRSLAVLDMTDYDDVPELASPLYLPTDCKILVKSGLLSNFNSATNWSSLSSQFIGV